MRPSTFKKSVLATNIALLMSGAMSVSAIAAEAEAVNTDNIEKIEVRGIRASQQANLNAKRFSDGTVDAITAEDIGKFPDKNVAESLQRIPGVTIQRQFGEGAGVSIRGAGQDLTLTTLNGQNVASTGWFVLEPAKRSFNYELLPSELVGDLEVYKSSQADIAEGGVGGTVIVNTRKPLDMDSLSFYGSVEGQYQSDSEETDPQFSGLASWKNDSETFGVLVSGVLQERSLQRQGNEAFWEWGAGPVAFEQERERSALTATFQYAPTDELSFVFNAMDMQMKANNTNYALWLTQADTSWGGGVTEEWLGQTTDADGNITNQGTQVKGPLNVAYWQARPREATMKSQVFDLKMEYAGNGYDFSAQIGDTTSSGGTDFEMVVDDGTGGTPIPGGSYDFTGGGQTWDTNGFDMATYDPGSLTMGTGSNFNRTPKTDDETYAQADIKFDVDWGVIDSVKTGIKYAKHNTTSRKFEYEQDANFDTRISTADIGAGTIDVGAGDYQIAKFDPEALKAWARSSITGEHEDLGSYSEIEEDNYAAYVMANFSGDGIRGNFGVRYAGTNASSTYYVEGKKTSTDADYAEWLPSLNVAFDLADDVIMRASAARVMARPQYVDMYVNPNVLGANDDTPNNQYWVTGNIGLKPFVANQIDLGIEWYFNSDSLVSAALFMKDVKNFVTISEYHATSDEIDFPLPPDEAANGWTVQEKNNGKSALIQGLELQYQQDYGNGFGSVVNYTYTDTETDADTFTDGNPFLSDSSKHSYNLTGYFENELFQVRLAYNWRSEYMLRESGSYGNRLHEDYGSLDLSATWHVTENIDIKLDGNNLLEESSKQFGNNQNPTSYSGFVEGFPLYEYEMARRITLGASFRF
ncbi:TonB-dependent receptor [Shewanella colwelliana]|uniref:TonB-dependent receptor n=2 Tax=Shewanella colwelliana TaxID=23 RepID=A0ABQ4P373_SHECO|nr:TonB-dependent receptor [Shewanella colwelliana]MDX1280570.1 TonB-dependent receptor [Shewanella colwelliana]GIU41926.1 TonB-dependent receptor [Shewanella colwelliana]